MTKVSKSDFLSVIFFFFFGELPRLFKTGSLKAIMDFFYAIFEKVAVHYNFFYTNYINFYQELIEKEINLLNISSDDSVLIIGCGSIPVTSILISQNSNAKNIVSIDCDLQAVKNATHFIDTTNFNKNLKFEHANGLEYPVENFDIIFIVYGIKKQDTILKHISKNMKNTTRVIFRTTNDSLIQFLGGKQYLDKYFFVEQSLCSEKFNDTLSFLLKKKC
jgi:ubiquinone/menaquinone biosynthesis C-methylase UbiE